MGARARGDATDLGSENLLPCRRGESPATPFDDLPPGRQFLMSAGAASGEYHHPRLKATQQLGTNSPSAPRA
jgi:hypothetical protein